LAERDRQTAALIIALRRRGLWPPAVPTVVLAESLTGSARRDANTNRLLKACDVRPTVPERVARRAAELRTKARRGSAVDALVVAVAEPRSTILTSDAKDLNALAANAEDVVVEVV
jgi:predicted nucleic acid-binding protein